MKLNKLKIDVKASEDGIWFDYNSEVKFKIARLNNKRYQLKYAIKLKEAFEEYGEKHVPEQVYKDMMAICLATCLMGWKGITNDRDESEFKYSEELAEQFMLDDEYKEIRDFVNLQANLRNNFRKKDIKNAKKPSPNMQTGS